MIVRAGEQGLSRLVVVAALILAIPIGLMTAVAVVTGLGLVFAGKAAWPEIVPMIAAGAAGLAATAMLIVNLRDEGRNVVPWAVVTLLADAAFIYQWMR